MSGSVLYRMCILYHAYGKSFMQYVHTIRILPYVYKFLPFVFIST